jgi:NAD(P)-dependent dehydrogenase (short-subunit alcohol dehydrogenase family)|tara:strand:+ start:406 stop:1101 length:696 start_codon:yes stop_codon:yes gene_type:complete
MRYNIILTGSSSGIGSSLGNHLTKEGHNVIGLSRRRNIQNNFETLQCDVSNYDQLKKTISKISRVDCLINNAGIARSGIKNEIKNFEKIIQTNLNGAYYMSQLLKQKLSKSNSASIINISSISAHQGALANPGYVSSKSAILGLTRALANDYGSSHIRVNSISLGYFKTPMTIKSHKEKKRRKLISSKTIINRWGDAKDLFGLVEYLISKKAGYITGQDFVVDGGWLAKGL